MRLEALDGRPVLVLLGNAEQVPATDATRAEVAMNPAVTLFVDRARAHRPDFHVSATHRAAMVALVR